MIEAGSLVTYVFVCRLELAATGCAQSACSASSNWPAWNAVFQKVHQLSWQVAGRAISAWLVSLVEASATTSRSLWQQNSRDEHNTGWPIPIGISQPGSSGPPFG